MKDAELFGRVRTTNPSAISHNDPAPITVDDLGRTVMVPHQVRDLVYTARAVTSTLAETTLLAGVAGVFHDLVYLTAANTTAAVVSLSLRSATGGGVLQSLEIPANNTLTFQPPVSIPQDVAGDSWTIQNAGTGDISTTQVAVTALFIRNV